jgi:hypothetical protein
MAAQQHFRETGMMNTRLWASLLACAVLCATVAEAKETSNASSKPSSASTRRAKAPKVPAPTGYGESRKERDQRLWRECKGRPNAGACEGFAN